MRSLESDHRRFARVEAYERGVVKRAVYEEGTKRTTGIGKKKTNMTFQNM